MTNEKMVNFKKIETKLLEANYVALEEKVGGFSVVTDENIKYENINRNGFDLLYSRRVTLKPQALFSISVKYLISCEFDDEAMKHFNGDKDMISAFIDKRKVEIIKKKNIGNIVSLLVAQLSSYHAMNPIILPPYQT